MSDVRITNLPDSGSPQAVAFKLYDRLDGIVPKSQDAATIVRRHLALYQSCLQATTGQAIEDPDFT